jgi:uncharacterized membrane protein YkgB
MPIDYEDDDRDFEPDADEPLDRDERIIARAKERIKTPAVVLLVVGIISAIASLYNIVSVLTMDQQFAKVEEQWDNDPKMNAQQKQDMKQMLSNIKGPAKVVVPISVVCGLITATIAIIGSVRIMNLKNKGLGTAGSVLSMFPILSGCCCLGLPVGIWVLIAMGKPEVKAGFAAVARASRSSDGY